MSTSHRPRVVITGIGIVSSLGHSIEEFGDRLFNGETGIGLLEGWEIPDERFRHGGQVKDFDLELDLPGMDTRRILRYSQFALAAAARAFRDADLSPQDEDRQRIGTGFSTSAGGVGETITYEVKRYLARGDRGVSPMAWAEYTPCACTTHVAIHFGLRGPAATHSSGCVSGIDATAWGVEQLRSGKAEVMVVGGADAPFFPFLWASFCRSGLLAPRPADGGGVPRPFSFDHDGIAVAEGGSALILETETHARLRGARIYGEITGIASVEEARPITDIDPSGEAFAITMQRSLRDAGIPIAAIDWVLTHGTGFALADCSESQGIETAMGDHAFHVPASSIRGAVGQSLASGGGFQVAAACLAIARQQVPPTINFTAPAEGCRLDYVPNVARTARVRRVLINTAGVGGTHAGLVLESYAGNHQRKSDRFNLSYLPEARHLSPL